MSFTDRSLKNLRENRFIYLLETIFGVLIKLICSHEANTTKESGIYCVPSICLVNMRELFL